LIDNQWKKALTFNSIQFGVDGYGQDGMGISPTNKIGVIGSAKQSIIAETKGEKQWH
jgi:hypothetical protein